MKVKRLEYVRVKRPVTFSETGGGIMFRKGNIVRVLEIYSPEYLLVGIGKRQGYIAAQDIEPITTLEQATWRLALIASAERGATMLREEAQAIREYIRLLEEQLPGVVGDIQQAWVEDEQYQAKIAGENRE